MSDIQELIERLEGASGPDRGLDKAIYLYLQPDALKTVKSNREAAFVLHRDAPLYTATIDAAVTIADEPERLTILFKALSECIDVRFVKPVNGRDVQHLIRRICIAALRTRAAS